MFLRVALHAYPKESEDLPRLDQRSLGFRFDLDRSLSAYTLETQTLTAGKKTPCRSGRISIATASASFESWSAGTPPPLLYALRGGPDVVPQPVDGW